MITEDYVSFETAKLLKEKGFDEICYLGYNKNGEYVPTSNRTNSQIIQPDFCFICCPTIQMTMKWRRIVHGLFIRVTEDITGSVFEWSIYQKSYGCRMSTCVEDSYEKACETAIRHCLENLI